MLRRERNPAEADSDSVVDRIGNRGRGGPLCAFADPQIRQARAIEEHGVDLGHLAETQDRIGSPVDAGDPMPVEGHLLVQRPARRLGESPLELIAQPVGVDDLARIHSNDGLLELNATAVTVDVQVHDHGDEALTILVLGKGHATSDAFGFRPGPLNGSLDHGSRTRELCFLTGKVLQAEGDRIDAGGVRQLVDERLDREDVGIRPQSRGAPRPARGYRAGSA